MAAGVYNFNIEQGATFRHRITVSQGDPPVPFSLVGYTAKLGIKGTIKDASYALLLTSAGPTTNGSSLTLSGDSGLIDILITDEDTEAFVITKGVYDLLLISGAQPGASSTRLLKGTVSIDPGVTSP